MNSNRKRIIYDGYSVLVTMDRAFPAFKLQKKTETTWELYCPLSASPSEMFGFLSSELKGKKEQRMSIRKFPSTSGPSSSGSIQDNRKTIKMVINGWKVRIERKELYNSISASQTDYDSIRVRCSAETEDKAIIDYIVANYCNPGNKNVVVTSGFKRKSPDKESQKRRRTSFYESDSSHLHVQTIDQNFMDHYNRRSDITETPSERLLNTDHGIRLQRHSPIYSSTTGQSQNITTKKKGKNRKKYDPKILNSKTAMVEKRNEELWREQE